ncbi:MAG: polyprenyl diphosphate synthase, partial [Burkholderiaceae bacterium]
AAGHARGIEAVRALLKACGEREIEYLTLFAFSSENWRRPPDEVSTLMRLFVSALRREADKLVELGVRMRVVGDSFVFDPELRRLIAESERRTQNNSRLHLTICANYGGRWDIAQAAARLIGSRPAGATSTVSEGELERHLALSFAPDPDLLIRTGGEQRISNFLLWQCAYSELWFTETLWPDFDAKMLDEALEWFAGRQRRFGMTAEQIEVPHRVPDAA